MIFLLDRHDARILTGPSRDDVLPETLSLVVQIAGRLRFFRPTETSAAQHVALVEGDQRPTSSA